MPELFDYAPQVRTLSERFIGEPTTHHNFHEFAERPAVLAGEKRIVVCADGTWNTPKKKDHGDESAATNVWLTYKLIKHHDSGGMPQLKYYHAGIGTGGNWLRRAFEGATGGGLEWNMLDCYRFLVENYNPGDHLYLVGFSRGAYTVRTLAGMIRNSGIIDRRRVASDQLDQVTAQAYEIYRDRSMDATPVAPKAVAFRDEYSHPDFRIAGIGVWDTVGARGIPAEKHSPLSLWNTWRYSFHDVSLSAYVDCAFHALAVDEQRGPFRSTLWIQQPHAKDEGQVLEQTWFPGAHSDVGGGNSWEKRGLATCSLEWMVGRFEQHTKLEFNRERLEEFKQRTGEAHLIRDSMTLIYRLLNGARLTQPFNRVIDSSLAIKGARDFDRTTTEVLADWTPLRPVYERRGRQWPPFSVTDYETRLAAWKDRRPPQCDPPAGLDRKPSAPPPSS